MCKSIELLLFLIYMADTLAVGLMVLLTRIRATQPNIQAEMTTCMFCSLV